MDVDKEIRKIKLLVELECNLPFGTLEQKTRKAEVVMARILFANILMFDIGLKPDQLIKYIGKHRTNYYHYKKLHNSYMDNPKIHPLYIRLYQEIRYKYFSNESSLFTNTEIKSKVLILRDIQAQMQKLEMDKMVLEEQIREQV